MIRHHHATMPGLAEYDPATHRNVPKYFTPAGASEILMPKPTAETRRPARTNGQRNFSLSEKWPKTNRVTAGKELSSGRWIRGSELGEHTCDRIRRHGEEICDGNRVSKPSDDRGQEERNSIHWHVLASNRSQNKSGRGLPGQRIDHRSKI